MHGDPAHRRQQPGPVLRAMHAALASYTLAGAGQMPVSARALCGCLWSGCGGLALRGISRPGAAWLGLYARCVWRAAGGALWCLPWPGAWLKGFGTGQGSRAVLAGSRGRRRALCTCRFGHTPCMAWCSHPRLGLGFGGMHTQSHIHVGITAQGAQHNHSCSTSVAPF